jgi:hypothetical protein
MQNEKFQQKNIISFRFISKSIYINFHPFGYSIFLKRRNIPTDEINYGKWWKIFRYLTPTTKYYLSFYIHEFFSSF